MKELTIKWGSLRDLSEKCPFCPLEPNNFTSWSKKSYQNSLDLDQIVALKQKNSTILTETWASE